MSPFTAKRRHLYLGYQNEQFEASKFLDERIDKPTDIPYK